MSPQPSADRCHHSSAICNRVGHLTANTTTRCPSGTTLTPNEEHCASQRTPQTTASGESIDDYYNRKIISKDCQFLLLLAICVFGAVSLQCATATPVLIEGHHSIFQLSPSARNIRHLPCVSRRTKEEGTCMFAIDCLKANGTHLGTCIDRFYFGSCCQVPDAQLDPGISDNRIEDNTVQGRPILSNSQGSYDNKPNLEKIDPLLASDIESGVTSQKPSIVSQKPSFVDNKPEVVVQHHVGSSQKPDVSSIKPGIYIQKPSVSTNKPNVVSQQTSLSSHKPYIKPSVAPNVSVKPSTISAKPQVSNSFTSQKPIVTQSYKPNINASKPIPGKPSGSVQRPEFNIQKPGFSSVKPTVSSQATTLSNQRPSNSNQKPGVFSHKPGGTHSKPGVSSQHHVAKPDYSYSKFNSTVNLQTASKPGYSSQATRKPYPSTYGSTISTKRPITIGVIVNNTYTSNFNSSNKYSSSSTATIDRTEEKDTIKVPDLMPSLKPTRHNTTSVVQPYSTSTYRPFSRPTKGTTQKPQTTISGHTNLYVNNQLYNSTRPNYNAATKKPVSDIQITPTESSTKLTTFQTVNYVKTTGKPSTMISVTSTGKPSNTISLTSTANTTSVRPSSKPSQYDTTKIPPTKPISDIPFGTRLPSSTVSPIKPSTSQGTKPVVNLSTVSQNTPSYVSTTTVASPQTQRPIQKPITSLKPDRPSSVTSRPAVHRPQNSTLSNRRTTTVRPTTVLIKDQLLNNQSNNTIESVKPTKKPATTVVYRPSLSTQGSVKPPSSTYQNTRTTQKPISTVGYQKPSVSSTVNPVKFGSNITSSSVKPSESSQNPKPKPETSSTATQGVSTVSTKPSTAGQTLTTSGTTKPNGSIKPTSKPVDVTKRPKPTVSVTTARPIQATVSPINNEIEGSLSQKPTVGVENQAVTTEKVGLVTWTNFVEQAVTQGTVYNTSVKDPQEEWSPATPPDGWVLLQTVTTNKNNMSTSTLVPLTTISLTTKPVTITEKPVKAPTTSSSSSPNTTIAEISTKTPAELSTMSSVVFLKPTKPIITIQVTTRPIVRPVPVNESSTEVPSGIEFSTFMSVSGGPSIVSESDKEEVTTIEYYETDNDTATTIDYEFANETEPSGNFTLMPDDFGSTEKSTVSPIEVITSTGSSVISTDSLNMSDYKDVCGRRLWPGARVVGGSRAQFGRWPWQVSLRQWRTSTYLHKCGAALLSDSWAVTAAHCVDSVPPSDLLLRLGEHDLASEEEPYGFQERRVQIVASHPQFDPRTFEYDLALLRFYEPVTFQPNILPVCVPTNDEGFVGKTAYVTGWGRLYEDGPLPSVLQEVSVPVLENSVCEAMYSSAGYIEHIPHIFICAGWRKGGFDSCEGDSGGPMVLQREDKRFILAGIISWGIGCAEPNQPGVYTRISEFRDWINQILQF